MSRWRPPGAIAGLCAAAALAGYTVGRVVGPPSAAPAPDELAAEIRLAMGEADPFERFGRAASLLRHLGPGSLPEVVAVYDEMLPVVGSDDIRLFVAAWARFDPAGALEHALDWPPKGRREAGAAAALEAWARIDPGTARHAYQEAAAEHPRLARNLLAGLVAGWVHAEGRPGLDLFLVNLQPASREAAVGVVGRELLRSGGADAVLAWADPILADGTQFAAFKRIVFRRALRSVARSDAERAAVWAAGHGGSDYGAEGLSIVAAQWGNRDGGAAMAWLGGQPAGGQRDAAVRRAFARWWVSDPTAALAWLDSGPPDGLEEPALAAYALERAAAEPAEALGECGRIRDEEQGLRCLVEVASRWYRSDATAAEAWLEQSPLDEEARRQVRTPRGRRQAAGVRRPRPR